MSSDAIHSLIEDVCTTSWTSPFILIPGVSVTSSRQSALIAKAILLATVSAFILSGVASGKQPIQEMTGVIPFTSSVSSMPVFTFFISPKIH